MLNLIVVNFDDVKRTGKWLGVQTYNYLFTKLKGEHYTPVFNVINPKLLLEKSRLVQKAYNYYVLKGKGEEFERYFGKRFQKYYEEHCNYLINNYRILLEGKPLQELTVRLTAYLQPSVTTIHPKTVQSFLQSFDLKKFLYYKTPEELAKDATVRFVFDWLGWGSIPDYPLVDYTIKTPYGELPLKLLAGSSIKKSATLKCLIQSLKKYSTLLDEIKLNIYNSDSLIRFNNVLYFYSSVERKYHPIETFKTRVDVIPLSPGLKKLLQKQSHVYYVTFVKLTGRKVSYSEYMKHFGIPTGKIIVFGKKLYTYVVLIKDPSEVKDIYIGIPYRFKFNIPENELVKRIKIIEIGKVKDEKAVYPFNINLMPGGIHIPLP